MSNDDERKVRLYPLAVNEDGLSGYVTACRLSCAQDYAQDMGLTLAQDAAERAEDEDEMGECDACTWPNPAYNEEVATHLAKPRGGRACGSTEGQDHADINYVTCTLCHAEHDRAISSMQD